MWAPENRERGRGRVKRCAAVVLILALWALAGCGAMPAGEAEQQALPAAETAGEGGLSAALLERQARPLAEEEILAAYDRAGEAYGWFYLETLPTGQERQTVDGWIYYRVDYPGMETLADLRAYLRGFFTEELTDQLLDEGAPHPLYQDVDGVLYALPTGRDRDATKGSTSFQVEMTGEDAYSVSVTVDLLEGPDGAVTGVERYAFPYEFVEDRWVFTDFRLIY